jgi:penicillin-binding protein 1A
MEDSQKREPRQPAKRRRKRKRKKSPVRLFFKVLFIVILVGGFALGGAALGAVMGIMQSTEPMNTEDVVPESYTSFIYDSNGNEIDKLHGEENREYVKLEYIPRHLKNAVISIEDERFYDHNGIDIRGIGRAMLTNIKTRSFSQGASTITQQLIKNEVLTKEKKLQRKIKEQYLAVSFEKSLSKQLGSKKKAKDYILELYLNSIALNHGLNGVEAAAKYYFGKEVSELDLAESACIAGITKNPSLYTPINHPDENKKRQMLVLSKMKELGYITESEYNQAASEDIYSHLVGNLDDESGGSSHSYFVDALIVQIAEDLMQQKNMNKSQAYNMIYSGGLKINATVDSNMQRILEEAFQDDSLFPPKGNTWDVTYTISVMDNTTKEQTHHTKTKTVKSESEIEPFIQSVKNEFLNSSNTFVMDKKIVTNSLQSAMTIMDQHNGEVKALVGGRGKKEGDLIFNRATQAYRQPGSCFKPLAAYAPAIDLGLVMPGTVIMDEPFSVGKWSPKNWNGKFVGPCTVREGIRDSMNVLAAKTIMMVGTDKAFEYLKNFGFTSLVESEVHNGEVKSDKGPAVALGGLTNGVSVLELTAAYAAIANGGLYYTPKFYTTVYDHNGNILLKSDETPKRVIKETTAYLLTDMMKDVITGGGSATGRLANFRKHKMTIAGKTGTTTDDKDLTFAGYTPYYCAGIWLGYDTPKPITYDKSYHLIVWRTVMEKIHENLQNKDFEKPAGIVSRSFCSVSGGVPSELCANDYYGNAISSDISAADFGSTTEVCKYHKKFKVDLSTGKLANEYCPPQSVSEVVLAVDSNGKILNKPSDLKGKVDIDIHSTCTEHNANTKWQSEQETIDSQIPIGGDYPSIPNTNPDSNDYLPPIGSDTSSTITDDLDIRNGDIDDSLFIPD